MTKCSYSPCRLIYFRHSTYPWELQWSLHVSCQDSLAFPCRRGKTLTEEGEDSYIYFKVHIPLGAASSDW